MGTYKFTNVLTLFTSYQHRYDDLLGILHISGTYRQFIICCKYLVTALNHENK